jgi:hypothetical protein
LYGTQIAPADEGISLVNLGFTFTYYGKEYTQVSISTNGYVCFGNNPQCSSTTRPSPFDILVGLNFDLDTTREGSGQIYYQNLSTGSVDFEKAKAFFYLLNLSNVEPINIFMITYDNVLPYYNIFTSSSSSTASFQIFLTTDSAVKKSFLTLVYTSCLTDLTLRASSGLNYNNARKLQEVTIVDGQQCSGTNVNQTGVWISDVTNIETGII